jgi:hypothetical protein
MAAQRQLTEQEEEILQAAEEADYREQWDLVRRRFAAWPPDRKLCGASLRSEYEEETGTWIGCD